MLCFLFLSPPFPLPLSLSPPPGYCAVLRAHTLSGASARPAAGPAATPRCPSAPQPRGRPLGAALAAVGGAAPAAARGCPSRGPALAAAPRIAALRKGRRGKEPGAAIDTAPGPLLKGQPVPPGHRRAWGSRPGAVPGGILGGGRRGDKGADLHTEYTPVRSRLRPRTVHQPRQERAELDSDKARTDPASTRV